MDIERGNIEILFGEIDYLAIGRQVYWDKSGVKTVQTYKKIDKKLYMRGAEKIFRNMTENERENSYLLACTQMKDDQGNNPSLFRLLTNISKKLLETDGDEIKCRFDQMLRWREISLPFGQVFRYLSDVAVMCKETQKDASRNHFKTRNLHTTYHAGEDFYDIADGLRAIDEALLFCGLKRGSRLGHALALKKAKDKDANLLYDIEDIYEWVDYVRRMGLEQVFV